MNWLRLWIYYHVLAISDLVRLWTTTQHHVIIIAGICLPILLLTGLKRGHVAQLRHELLTSPTGRQVIFWSAQRGELLNSESLQTFQERLAAVELMIPDQQRLITLQGRAESESAPLPAAEVTLYATRPGDPVLRQSGADVLKPGETAVVLPAHVAEAVKATTGDTITVVVRRKIAGIEDTATIPATVKAIYPSGPEKTQIAYADARVLDQLELYVRGAGVREYGWPAARLSARDRYASYLVFCEPVSDLKLADREVLSERGLRVEEVKTPEEKSLWGLIRAERLDELKAYRITSLSSATDAKQRLIIAPSEIAELTGADDVVVPWNPPRTIETSHGLCTLVGLSLPSRIWLREYLADADVAFGYDLETPAVHLPESRPDDAAKIEFDLRDGDRITLPVATTSADEASPEAGESNPPSAEGDDREVEAPAEPAGSDAPTDSPTQRLAIVPADFFARLDAYFEGLALYDPASGLLTPLPAQPTYDKVRLYCHTIDGVPATVETLLAEGYAVMSESTRITEIHGQDQSLQILVWVVGIGVFAFGIVTVVSVLLDSTDRKRGTIGILRVMGVSRAGIFYLVLFRAAAIGFLAGAVSFGVGMAASSLLGWEAAPGTWAAWKPVIQVILDPRDVGMVFSGALICSCLGAFWPALRASRMDPFDAIVEGRFR